MQEQIQKIIEKAIEGGWVKEVHIISKGKKYAAYVSCVDFPLVSQYRWFLTQKGYAVAWIGHKRVKMHHLIFGKPQLGLETDHINRNPLDNRRTNLRFVSSLENAQNKNAVGVRRRGNSWEANLCFNYKKYFKGGFNTEEEALKWRSKMKNKLNKNYERNIR